MRKIILSTGVIMLVFTNAILAQDSLKVLNEVVITATRTEQEIIDVARTVEIIDEKEIRETSYNSVGELLARKTAMFIIGGTQTPGTNQDVFLRGANSNHVVVLIDGVRVTDPSSPNNAFNLAELSLANVERIEIVHGAHSTLYGTAAMGGTINIITKKGSTGLNGYGSLQGGVFEKGNLSEGSGYVNYGLKNGFYIAGSAFHQRVNGIDASMDTITSTSYKTNDPDNFNKTDVSIKTGYRKKNLEGFLEFKRANQHADIDDGAFDDDDNYFVKLNRDFLNYGMSFSTGKWRFSFNGGYSRSEREAVNDSSIVSQPNTYDQTFFSSAYKGSVLTNEFLINYKADRATFIMGIGKYGEAMDFNTYYFTDGPFGIYESTVNYDSLDISASIFHVFLAGNLIPLSSKKLSISYGVRVNKHNSFGNHFTWEVNPSWKVGAKATAYFSYSKGFNAPSLYQLYDPTPGYQQGLKRGNEELNPEHGRSMEAGWKQLVADDISFTLSVFDNIVNDAIEYVYIWNGATSQEELSYMDYMGDTYVNINKQNIRGIEGAINGKINTNIDFYFNATVLKAQTNLTNGELIPKYIKDDHIQVYSNGLFFKNEESDGTLVRRPGTLVNAGLGYLFGEALKLSLDYQYIGARSDAVFDPFVGPYGALGTMDMESFNLFSLTGNYTITDNFTAILTVKNLFNQKYNEINGFNSLGRSGFIKVLYEF